jgi:phosphohistidine phosphatase
MDLLIVRHAHAGSREEFAKTSQPDELRPLTTKGVHDMKEVARGLRRIVPTIDLVVSSPLVRARQTADIVADEYGVEIVESATLRPDEEFESFVSWARSETTGDVIAAVGHEPHLSGLVAYLIGESGDARIDLKKSGAGLLRFEGQLKRADGTLRWLLTPSIALDVR